MQEKYLNAIRKNKVPCTIFMVNGFQIRGKITAFDNFAIIVTDENNHQMMLYKHAISTISPQSVTLNLLKEIEEESKE